MYNLYARVLFKGIPAKITCVLSDDRYQLYTQSGEVLLAYGKDLVAL
jgi:hypothetical protein